MKNAKLLIVNSILFILLVFLMSFTKIRYNQTQIKELKLNIENSPGNFFLNPDFINNLLLEDQSLKIKGNRKQISLREIEAKLCRSSFVESSDVYIDENEELCLDIKEETPIARIKTKNKEFYLTKSGKKMSKSPHHSAEVILVGGNIQDKDLKNLHKFLMSIGEDKLFKTITIGVHKQRNNSYKLLTTLGGCSIEFGALNNLEDKIENFKIFYKKRMRFLPNDYYESIDLQYNNQVVAKKREI